jgi:hypothetical protein
MAEALRAKGLESDRLSVAKEHYEDFALLVAEERVKGYRIPLLVEEMLQLRIIKGNKVDHPATGSKDLADAVCGALYNSVLHTVKDDGEDVIVEAEFLDTPKYTHQTNKPDQSGVIVAPKKPDHIPDSISDYLAKIQVL